MSMDPDAAPAAAAKDTAETVLVADTTDSVPAMATDKHTVPVMNAESLNASYPVHATDAAASDITDTVCATDGTDTVPSTTATDSEPSTNTMDTLNTAPATDPTDTPGAVPTIDLTDTPGAVPTIDLTVMPRAVPATDITEAVQEVGPMDTESQATPPVADDTPPPLPPPRSVFYEAYQSELQMPDIMRLMKVDLSEPYSIYTYRYFIHNWPQLCILAKCDGKYVGAIVCKLEMHHYQTRRGYIAMLAVDRDYRKKRIGTNLVMRSIRQMALDGCDEVVLETEVTNDPALKLYENLGFVRDKYLHQYYLNGVDAYRLKLWLKDPFEV